jgi:hypothetical protein
MASCVLIAKHLSSETSKKTGDEGKKGSNQTVAKANKKRAEGTNKTRNDSADETNKQDENLGKDLEDGVQNRVKLSSDAENSNKTLDKSRNLNDESNGEGLNSLDIRIGNIKASSTGKLPNEAGKSIKQTVELREGLIRTFLLGDVTTLNLVKNVVWRLSAGGSLNIREYRTKGATLSLDGRNSTLKGGDQALRGGNAGTLGDLNMAGGVVSVEDRGSKGRHGQSNSGEENSLHDER